VTCGLEALIEEHLRAIETFGEDTRQDTIERAAERIKITRHKLAAYSVYLGEQRDRLERDLALAQGKLRARVETLAVPAGA